MLRNLYRFTGWNLTCRPLLLFVLPVLVLAGCVGEQKTSTVTYNPGTAEIPSTGPSVPGVERYDQAIKAIMKKWNIPGAAVAVTKDGRLILARGYGHSDYEAREQMRPNVIFRIGSISKTLTAVALLKLVEEEKVDLDARFLDVLPQYHLPANADPRLRTITLRNILQHAGGWDMSISGDPETRSDEIVRTLGVPAPATCTDFIQYMLGKPLDFEPGTKFVYSNFAYCIIARTVEKITGRKYEEYVRDTVLTQMDIGGMAIGRTRAIERFPNETKYYDYPGAPYVQSVVPGDGMVPRPYGMLSLEAMERMGGWTGSVVDLTRFMSSLDGTRGTSFLSPPIMEQMTARPTFVAGEPYWYGLGIDVTPFHGGMNLWHGGSMPGVWAQVSSIVGGYTWAVAFNSRPDDLQVNNFANEAEQAMWTAFGSGLDGSPVDLYPQFPSPQALP